MRSKRCFVIDCLNDERSNVKFHRLPTDANEQVKWLAFLDKVNQNHHNRPYSTTSIRICSDHFPPSNRRTKDAPCLVNGNFVSMPAPAPKYSTDMIPFATSPCDLWPLVIDLSEKLEVLQAVLDSMKKCSETKEVEIKNYKRQIKSLQRQQQRQSAVLKRKSTIEEITSKRPKYIDASVDTKPEDFTELLPANKLLYELNSRILNSTKNHSEHIKNFSFELHFRSPSAYEFVRESLANILPHKRTFPRWIETVQAKPGILPNAIEFLQREQLRSQYEICHSLIFDEVYIKQQILHNKNDIVGFVDYGGLAPESTADRIAKTALFFMVVQINGSNKVPVAYVLTDGLNTELLATITKNVIRKLLASQIRILTVTYDGLPTNQKVMEMLGANLNPLSTMFKPFFNMEDNESKIFNLFDPSHMFKLFRNMWKSLGIIYTADGKEIDWGYVEKLNSLQEQCGLKLANKLTSRHVHFETNKMKTKLCIQTLSNSISVAIGVCRKLKQDGFERSEPTEHFIATLNRLFDVMNSRVSGTGYNSPLKRCNYHMNRRWLINCKSFLLGLHKKSKGNLVPIISTKIGTAIKGLVITISSLVEIMDNVILNSQEDLQYLPIYKWSQDHIELYFGLLRGRHGRNNNPNVMQLRSAVRDLLCMKIRDRVSGNCFPLEDMSTLVSPFESLQVITENDNGEDIDEEFPVLDYDTDAIVSNVVAYIAGFVVRKLCKRVCCSMCICLLSPSEPITSCSVEDDYLLIVAKNNGGLLVPSLGVVKICKVAESSVRYWQQKGLKKLERNIVVSTAVRECAKLGYVGQMSCSNDSTLREIKEGSLHHHGLDLIKKICEEFTKIRLHHIAKCTSLQLNPVSNRTLCTKLVHFKGN